MKKLISLGLVLITVLSLTLATSFVVFADNTTEETAQTENVAEEEKQQDNATSSKAIAAAACVMIAASAGAIGMGIAVKAAAEGTARQPEASGDIRTTMLMGLVFIETAIIYALIVAILVIFVL